MNAFSLFKNTEIGIYKITCAEGKVYIGQSKNLTKRIQQYKTLNCIGQPKIYKSLMDNGVVKHKFEIIKYCNKNYLNYYERFYQQKYNSVLNGYNCHYTKSKRLPIIKKIQLQKIGFKKEEVTLFLLSLCIITTSTIFYIFLQNQIEQRKTLIVEYKKEIKNSKNQIQEIKIKKDNEIQYLIKKHLIDSLKIALY
jgi:hypothetical protein